MITLHLYRDRDGKAVAKIDSPEGRRALSDIEKAEALTLLTQAGESTAYQHPREAAEWRIVSRLASLMRKKLAKRRHHGDWRGLNPNTLYRRLHEEVGELASALSMLVPRATSDEEERAAVIGEAVDVAAYAAFLIDVLVGDER